MSDTEKLNSGQESKESHSKQLNSEGWTLEMKFKIKELSNTYSIKSTLPESQGFLNTPQVPPHPPLPLGSFRRKRKKRRWKESPFSWREPCPKPAHLTVASHRSLPFHGRGEHPGCVDGMENASLSGKGREERAGRQELPKKHTVAHRDHSAPWWSCWWPTVWRGLCWTKGAGGPRQ